MRCKHAWSPPAATGQYCLLCGSLKRKRKPAQPASPAPGMPSEEEIARAICADDFDFDETVYDTLSPRQQSQFLANARAVLSLIRPAFEANTQECQAICDSYADENQRLHDRALFAEAKLAQAVEAMEPFDDALGEDDEGYGDGLTVVMKWGACTDYSTTLGDLRDLRKAARTASAIGKGE